MSNGVVGEDARRVDRDGRRLRTKGDETMSCPNGEHDLRATNSHFVKDREGKDVEIAGAPPETEEESAWCKICGALRIKKPFSKGWGFIHPLIDEDAPTLINILRKHHVKDKGNDE